jgi:hypothetical protein
VSPTLTITGVSGPRSRSTSVGLLMSAPSIGINFVGSGVVAMGASESAGMVAKINWNNATGAVRTTPLALVSETGTATGATVTWNASGVWNTAITDQVGNRRMMKGYLTTSATSATTVTVAGLPAATYDVYVFVDGANGGASRSGTYRISGTGIVATTINAIDAPNTDFTGTLVPALNSAGNVVKFTITAAGFTLTGTPGAASDNVPRAPINGLQIVPASISPLLTLNFRSNPYCSSITISGPSGFNCTVTSPASKTCSQNYPQNTALQLATSFIAAEMVWTGCDSLSAENNCNVTLASNKTIGAEFRGGDCGYFRGISVTPTAGTIDTNFVETGFSFTPNWTVTRHHRFNGVETPTTTRTTDADGRLSAVSLPDKQVGDHEIWEVDDNTGVDSNHVTYTVLPSPDFTVAVTPATRTVTPGGSTTYTVTFASVNGFAGTITPSASGLPAGTTASFSPPTVTGGGSTTLTVATGATTPAGNVTLAITGTSGTQVRQQSTELRVVDFTVAASPATRTVTAGSATTYTVTVGALNGFTGNVALSLTGLPANTTAVFSPQVVTNAGTSTLTVTTASTTPLATSALTVTGTSGTRTRTAAADLTVTGATTLRALSINFVGGGAGMAATESAGVVARTNWNNAAGASRTTALALVNDAGAATTATATWTSNGVWITPITDQAGNNRLMKGYLTTSNTSASTVTVSGLAMGTYDVYVLVDGANAAASRAAAYRISGTGITTTTINLTDAPNANFNGTFTQANNSAGNYVVFTITATGFTLTATPGAASDAVPRAPINGVQIIPR